MNTSTFMKALTNTAAANWTKEVQARIDAAANSFAARAAAAKAEMAAA